ncbi:MAG: L-aspartate oxidase [Calditrichia bacterium]
MAECLTSDVLIIGCGIAGGVAALQLADAGVSVTLITRASNPEESNTFYAQGGIIYRGKNDSPELLEKDLKRAGAGLSDPASVQIMAEEGPDLVWQLLVEKLEIPFDRLPNGELSLVTEGSHSLPRILHVKDKTGMVIEKALINRLQNHPNIRLLKDFTAVDLLTPSHHSKNRLAVYQPHTCVGAYLYDQKKEQVIRCLASVTILATGGLGQIFLRTSNPAWARGDGLAMAYRAGARVINNEYIQFHPTTFQHKTAPRFLISESVRGAGARLVLGNGEPFMQKYDPEWKDLAPRDVVARSIHTEMLLNDLPNVYLDMHSYIEPEKIRQEFPTIYQNCLQYGIDATREAVPVVPAAHYFCGGVWVDGWGRTTIRNLYAIGEVSCTGVHGANRLASASLLEGVVWGHRAALHIREHLPHYLQPDPGLYPQWEDFGLEKADPALISQDMSSIKHIMWSYVGLVRTRKRLARALRELRNLESEIEEFYRVTRLSDGLIGLRNAVRVAIIVTMSAWENKRSIGSHYRES